ncbi:type VI secretion system tube protein Hcp [Neolewinella antarctica]|uniref:Type VI protein secretion system component Hcp n=1 Tax=Neolewinella antarctica TaxID=442734 RepID=A0ABX0XD18_9BACT|nr:type VI secretion system tube protein Hcp [Neolewinella antarctica]NJC27165.1 type VI protein secretion system component Hcp [Neolewinella antarctica]
MYSILRSATLITLLATLPFLAGAQEDYFLQVPDVPGEADIVNYERQICISSFSWGVASSTEGSQGGGTAGVAVQEDFLLGKSLDIATVKIFEAVTLGKSFSEVTLTVLVTGSDGSKRRLAEYIFVNLKFSSIQPGGDSEGTLKEVIGIVSELVTVRHFDESGSFTNEFTWNFDKNAPG